MRENAINSSLTPENRPYFLQETSMMTCAFFFRCKPVMLMDISSFPYLPCLISLRISASRADSIPTDYTLAGEISWSRSRSSHSLSKTTFGFSKSTSQPIDSRSLHECFPMLPSHLLCVASRMGSGRERRLGFFNFFQKKIYEYVPRTKFDAFIIEKKTILQAAVVAVAGAAGLVAVVVVEVVAIPHLAGPQLTSVEAVTMAVATAVEAAGEITQYGCEISKRFK